MAGPLIRIDDLHISYGAIEALKGISLQVDEGEIVTVLGANGAGKSTLLRAISGLLPVRHGAISYRGETLTAVPAFEIVLRGISHAPEGRKVFATLTVEENLNLGAFTRRRRTREVAVAKSRVFALFPILRERRRQLAGTLSGGEQQMLAIGRGLMAGPKLIMFDEPSLGLAPILVQSIFDMVLHINKTLGVTVLLVEQNVRHSCEISDRAFVLENGKMVLHGTGLEMLENDHVREAYLGL